MNIGKKIYDLRCAKLMTQAELAGDQITRNMLCLIEKGTANPSISTVTYIAKKLNVSPGYLLAEDEEESMYSKAGKIENIKRAFEQGDYKICRDICLACIEQGIGDDEIYFIIAECNIRIAEEKIFSGELKSAADYISESLEYSQMTIYYTDHISSYASLAAEYLSSIAPSLDMGLEKTGFYISEDLFYSYMYVMCNFEDRFSIKLSKEFKESFYNKHILAKELIKSNKYDEAFEYLEEILKADAEIPSPFLYSVFSDLETCCKERNDFKGAYEYSSNKIQLFEKMLSEN